MNGTRDFAFAQELSIEDRTKKRRIVLPGSSMSVASAEGSLWDTAVAILMLRHSMMTETLCYAVAKMREAHAAE